MHLFIYFTLFLGGSLCKYLGFLGVWFWFFNFTGILIPLVKLCRCCRMAYSSCVQAWDSHTVFQPAVEPWSFLFVLLYTPSPSYLDFQKLWLLSKELLSFDDRHVKPKAACVSGSIELKCVLRKQENTAVHGF